MNDFKLLLREAAERGSYKPTLSLMVSIWPAAVGPEISRQSRPCGLMDDTLVIEVSPTWSRELQKSSGQIKARLNDLLPWPVSALHFVDGPPAAPQCTQRPKDIASLNSDELELISTLPAGLQDLARRITAQVKGEK